MIISKKLDPYFSKARVKGIFVANSRVHRVAAYLEEQGLNHVRLLGYDLLPENVEYLRKGIVDFLISQKPEEQGYRGIMTLFNMIILKKEVQESSVYPHRYSDKRKYRLLRIPINLTMGNHSFSDLKDKVCVITGGAGVIGTAIVKALASVGVKTIILDLRKDVAEELR